ncbi:MAG: hypothetical protein ACREC6_10065 [Hyphomicrobiaceae bacterium]
METTTGPFTAFYDFGWFPRVVQSQAVLFKVTQQQLLNEHRTMFDRWCERRCRTVDGLATLAQQAAAAKNPMEAVQALMTWSEGAIARLSEDAGDQLQLGAVWGRLYAANPFMAALNYEQRDSDAGRGLNGRPAAGLH